jgi:uncharacterized membrane protein
MSTPSDQCVLKETTCIVGYVLLVWFLVVEIVFIQHDTTTTVEAIRVEAFLG